MSNEASLVSYLRQETLIQSCYFAILLFLVTRYSAVINTLWVILDLAPWPGRDFLVCAILVYSEMGLNLALLGSAAIFSALRVYAIYGKNLWIFTAVLLLGLSSPAISLYTFTQAEAQDIATPQSCGYAVYMDEGTYDTYMMISRATSIAADGFVLYLTWSKTRAMRSSGLVLLGARETLSMALLRNGGVYFALLLILNVVGLGVGRDFFIVNGMSGLIANLTSILTSRYIINLRRVTDATATEPSGEFSLKTLVFADVPADGAGEHSSETGDDWNAAENHGSTEIEV